MSYTTINTYTGDGIQANFAITFPFLSPAHVKVFVNDIFQLQSMNYTLSGSSVIFNSPPGAGDVIQIKRQTSPTAPLVDFQDGSVLRETDLDTAYLHNFYLSQEYADSFSKMILDALMAFALGNNITVIEPDEVLNQLVSEMVASAAAANLQARITDIDANAEAIITLGEGLQVQINTLAQGTAAVVFLQPNEPVPGVDGVPNPIPEGARWYDSDDNNKPYLYQSGLGGWVSIEDPRIGDVDVYINALQTQYGQSASAFIDEVTSISNEAGASTQALTLLGAVNGTNDAFILDLSTTRVGPTESLADRFTNIQASYEGYTDAEILTEQTARANADSAIASDLSLLGAKNGGATAFILDTSTVKIDNDTGDTFATRLSALSVADSNNAAAISTIQSVDLPALEARYGVSLDVNGYVTGFVQNNDGQAGSFAIIADKFAILQPGTLAQKVYWSSGLGKLQIDGDLMVTGTINGGAIVPGTIGNTQIGPNSIYSPNIAADQITAIHIDANAVTAEAINITNLATIANAQTGSLSVTGTLTMGTTGVIQSSGAGGFAANTGFFLGYSSGYKFSVGNFSSGNYMKWDGTTLTVKGDLFVGVYQTSTNTLLSATTERSQTGGDSKKKQFTIDRAGAVNIKFDYKGDNSYTNGQVRVKKNGVTINTTNVGLIGWTTKTVAVTGIVADDTVELWLDGGQIFTDAPEPSATYCRNVYIQADVAIPADGGTVDLD